MDSIKFLSVLSIMKLTLAVFLLMLCADIRFAQENTGASTGMGSHTAATNMTLEVAWQRLHQCGVKSNLTMECISIYRLPQYVMISKIVTPLGDIHCTA